MTPAEMQKRIEHLREDARVLYSIASEPGQTPVHQEGVTERDGVLTGATDADVDAVLAEF